MKLISLPPKLSTNQYFIFGALMVVTFVTETLVMFLLPYLFPDTQQAVVNFADAALLSLLIAPVVWGLITEPLHTLATAESARTDAVLKSIADAVVSFGENGVIESVNPAAERLFGYQAHEIMGKGIHRVIPEICASASPPPYQEAATTQSRWRICSESVARHKNGSTFPMESSIGMLDTRGRRSYLAIVHDITERKRYEEQLEFQANHDALTGLPNLNLLSDRIRQALLISRRSKQEVGVFLLDLDNFKLINDTLGHDSGDQLLNLIAQRLNGMIRAGDTVARQGGDEFIVIVSDQALSENAPLLAEKILDVVAQPLAVDGREVVLTVSIGICIYPRDGEDPQSLVKNAEVAMYRAKEQGRNCFQFYTGEMNAKSLARMTLENHLRYALEREELTLYYQPKVNLASGQITGMEALLRWQSPELGMITPDAFIPLAEETGLVVPIGAWVLKEACAQAQAWRDAGLPPLVVAVNLSPRQFRQQDIAAVVAQCLRETGLDPRCLELEITESMVMQDSERVTSVLNQLKRMGVSLAMDDFGTGYSSLGYLKRFPFDKLKIDKSFVRDITSEPNNAAIAKTVIAMAHSLHMKVIAEGVETQGQLNYLRLHGCDEMQGYFFSRPVPAEKFERLLREPLRLPQPAPAQEGAQKTVLLVDDDEKVISSLQRLLALDGYVVLRARNALEGFEQLALNRVAVIVSDFRMPGMNGAEFLGRAKELYPETVRIMLSGHADFDSVTDAVNLGAIYKFLNKPWSDDDVREKIDQAFRLYALHKAA